MKTVYNGFLTTQDKIIAHNARLDQLKVTGARLSGAWIQDRPWARAEVVTRTSAEMRVQLQAKCAHWDRQALKVVQIVLSQAGGDVSARADWGAYTTPDHAYGYDLSGIVAQALPNTDDEGQAPIAESADSQGFAVSELHFALRPSRSILVDGSNIARHFPGLRTKALDHLLECLKAKGYDPTVLFDANVRYVLKETGDVYGEEYLERLLQEDREHAQIVPSETISDDFILLLADKLGCPIVTCDTFRQERYRKLYPWLKNRVESGKKRVHAPAFVLGKLLIPTLGICWQPSERGDVYIRANCNGKFFCADEGEKLTARPVFASREAASDWERFGIIGNPDGTVALKSRFNGRYVSAEIDSDGRLVARAEKVGAWERFWLSRREQGGHCTLRSFANGRYVSVDPSSGVVSARAAVADEWELLTIRQCDTNVAVH